MEKNKIETNIKFSNQTLTTRIIKPGIKYDNIYFNLKIHRIRVR